jgi:hypothetical protein
MCRRGLDSGVAAELLQRDRPCPPLALSARATADADPPPPASRAIARSSRITFHETPSTDEVMAEQQDSTPGTRGLRRRRSGRGSPLQCATPRAHARIPRPARSTVLGLRARRRGSLRGRGTSATGANEVLPPLAVTAHAGARSAVVMRHELAHDRAELPGVERVAHSRRYDWFQRSRWCGIASRNQCWIGVTAAHRQRGRRAERWENVRRERKKPVGDARRHCARS